MGETDQLKIITDTRNSTKAEKIQQQAWGEACWYFPQTREQFRLIGQLTLINELNPDILLQPDRTHRTFLSQIPKSRYY